jgi:hypothetical protein
MNPHQPDSAPFLLERELHCYQKHLERTLLAVEASRCRDFGHATCGVAASLRWVSAKASPSWLA